MKSKFYAFYSNPFFLVRSKNEFLLLGILFSHIALMSLFGIEAWGQDRLNEKGKAVAFIQNPGGGFKQTAFFIGSRGYLLTAFDMSKIPQFPIGKEFDINWYNPSEQKRVDGKAAIVDYSERNGISLLRLEEATKPFGGESFIAIEDLDEITQKSENQQLTILYRSDNAHEPESTTCKLGQLKSTSEGALLCTPNNTFNESMIGSPVFWKGKLIGIVRGGDSIHPIRHATPFITMAEHTIIGENSILSLLGENFDSKTSKVDSIKAILKNVDEFSQVINFVRKSGEIKPRIIKRQSPGRFPLFYVQMKIQKKFNIEKEPDEIFASGDYEWTYVEGGASDGKVREICWQDFMEEKKVKRLSTTFPSSPEGTLPPETSPLRLQFSFHYPRQDGLQPPGDPLEPLLDTNGFINSLKYQIKNNSNWPSKYQLTDNELPTIQIGGINMEWNWKYHGEIGDAPIEKKGKGYIAIDDKPSSCIEKAIK